MVIFHSYVSLPEGTSYEQTCGSHVIGQAKNGRIVVYQKKKTIDQGQFL